MLFWTFVRLLSRTGRPQTLSASQDRRGCGSVSVAWHIGWRESQPHCRRQGRMTPLQGSFTLACTALPGLRPGRLTYCAPLGLARFSIPKALKGRATIALGNAQGHRRNRMMEALWQRNNTMPPKWSRTRQEEPAWAPVQSDRRRDGLSSRPVSLRMYPALGWRTGIVGRMKGWRFWRV